MCRGSEALEIGTKDITSVLEERQEAIVFKIKMPNIELHMQKKKHSHVLPTLQIHSQNNLSGRVYHMAIVYKDS